LLDLSRPIVPFRWALWFFLCALAIYLFSMSVSIFSVNTDHDVSRLRAEIGASMRQDRLLEIRKSELMTETRVIDYARKHRLVLANPASVIYLH
jgi:cell division protein FtsL